MIASRLLAFLYRYQFALLVMALLLLVMFFAPHTVYADHCLEDPLNAADCMRTPGFRPAINILANLLGMVPTMLAAQLAARGLHGDFINRLSRIGDRSEENLKKLVPWIEEALKQAPGTDPAELERGIKQELAKPEVPRWTPMEPPPGQSRSAGSMTRLETPPASFRGVPADSMTFDGDNAARVFKDLGIDMGGGGALDLSDLADIYNKVSGQKWLDPGTGKSYTVGGFSMGATGEDAGIRINPDEISVMMREETPAAPGTQRSTTPPAEKWKDEYMEGGLVWRREGSEPAGRWEDDTLKKPYKPPSLDDLLDEEEAFAANQQTTTTPPSDEWLDEFAEGLDDSRYKGAVSTGQPDSSGKKPYEPPSLDDYLDDEEAYAADLQPKTPPPSEEWLDEFAEGLDDPRYKSAVSIGQQGSSGNKTYKHPSLDDFLDDEEAFASDQQPAASPPSEQSSDDFEEDLDYDTGESSWSKKYDTGSDPTQEYNKNLYGSGKFFSRDTGGGSNLPGEENHIPPLPGQPPAENSNVQGLAGVPEELPPFSEEPPQ